MSGQGRTLQVYKGQRSHRKSFFPHHTSLLHFHNAVEHPSSSSVLLSFIMVAFSTIFLGLAAVTTSFAAPVADPDLPPHVERRGPSNFVLTDDHPLMIARRNASLAARTNYVQDYTTGGTVDFTHSGDSFSLSFNTKEDFVVGIGWNPGSTAYNDSLPFISIPFY